MFYFSSFVHGNERGASMLELAVVAPWIILIIAGLVDFGLALQEVQYVADAARQGARTGSAASFILDDPDTADEEMMPCSDSALLQCLADTPQVINSSDAIDTVAYKAACNHMIQSRLDPAFWEIAVNISDNLVSEGVTVQSQTRFMNVVIKRVGGASCIICYDGMFDNFLAQASTTFPLEKNCNG